MKKTYSQDQLKEKAAETFGLFPNAKKVYATVDGNIFLDENRANIHAGPEGDVLPFDRPVDEASAKPAKSEATAKEYPMNSTNTVKAIKAAQTLEELEKFKDDERATVIAALEKRKTDILSAITVTSEIVPGTSTDKADAGTGANEDADKDTNPPSEGTNPQE